MASSKYCQVEVSWPVLEGHSVDDIVIYNIESEGEDSQVQTNSLDNLTDLFLTCPSEDPSGAPTCTAVITFTHPASRLAIAAVDVLSNARNVEVFSSTGEYIVLAEGNKLDVAGERKLFLSQHTFQEPQTTCSLKFVSLVDPSRLWLHSLHLTLTACKTSPDFPLAIGPVINMDKVNAIMADMDATVPDRAKGLMSAMTAVQKNKEKTLGSLGPLFGGGKGPPTMASIMGMFASMSLPTAAPLPAPEVSAKVTPVATKVTQDKTEMDRNSSGKSKPRKNKSGKNKGNNKNNGEKESDRDKVGEGGKEKNQKKDKANTPRTEEKKKDQNSGSLAKKSKSDKDVKEKCETSSNSASGGSKKKQPKCPPAEVKSAAADVDQTTPVTRGDLLALEQRLQERIQRSEETILEELTSRVEASEQRIVQHMDNLLSKMASVFLGGAPMVNGANCSGDVTLD